MMGLSHLTNNNQEVVSTGDNIMSYSDDAARFTGKQLMDVWDALLSGSLNQGSNFEIYQGKTTDNWTDYFTSSTNEEPWDKNVKNGEKIPKTLKTPTKSNDKN
jgi:hypothetical protein